MIIEALTVGAVVKTFHSVNKSLNMDEKALKKYAKAFERSEEADLMVRQKAEFTDKRLKNVAKKKRAIVERTVPQFVEIYSQIQQIELEQRSDINEIVLSDQVKQLAKIDALTISTKTSFTDKELISAWVFKGIGKVIEMDSKQYLSAANSQMSAANVIYSQSESVVAIYDAIIGRADRIANLLMAMNALFVRSIRETDKTIQKNGLDVRNYSEYEKGVLMTCVNIAMAVAEIINIPVVDEQGQIVELATEMIVTGENYVEQMNKALQL